MDRRVFVAGGLAGLTLAAGDLLAAPAKRAVGSVLKQPPLALCRTRKDIRNLTAAELAALKKGVMVMKARPSTDPTSWAYQAAIHGSTVSPAKPLWNSCQHGSLHFFSWHRLFLHYFESILRTASGSASLTLPFWNWQAQRALPAPFVDNTAGNPLFVGNRNAAMNGGGLLPTSSISTTSSFAETLFGNFSGDFEGTPHGAVHVSVGGWMSSVPTAAQDPIFWLHHCNVDRLWTRWLAQGGGRVNPGDAAWLNRTFTFFDANGQQVTRKASDALTTCDKLGYTYPAVTTVLRPGLLAKLLPATMALAAPIEEAPAQALTLAGGVTRTTVAISRPITEAAPGAPARQVLAFEGIKVANPEGYYEIYLNPAKAEGLNENDPSYAGNLVFFGLPLAGQGGDHAMHDASDRRLFDVTRKLADLRRRGMVKSDNVNVVLVLRLPEGGGQQEAVQAGPRATIERVRLVAQ